MRALCHWLRIYGPPQAVTPWNAEKPGLLRPPLQDPHRPGVGGPYDLGGARFFRLNFSLRVRKAVGFERLPIPSRTVNGPPASTLNHCQNDEIPAMTPFQTTDTVNLPQGATHD